MSPNVKAGDGRGDDSAPQGFQGHYTSGWFPLSAWQPACAPAAFLPTFHDSCLLVAQAELCCEGQQIARFIYSWVATARQEVRGKSRLSTEQPLNYKCSYNTQYEDDYSPYNVGNQICFDILDKGARRSFPDHDFAVRGRNKH